MNVSHLQQQYINNGEHLLSYCVSATGKRAFASLFKPHTHPVWYITIGILFKKNRSSN